MNRALIGIATATCVATPTLANAGWWVHDDGDLKTAPSETAIYFTPYIGVWAGNYERPSRACKPLFTTGFEFPEPVLVRSDSLRKKQVDDEPADFTGCYTEDSDEIGISAGGELTFRVVGPLHFTAGVYFVYTFPNRDYELKNQVIIPLQFGVLLTWPEWSFRPIVAAEVTPLLYITDDSRDYALGGKGGFAWRVSGFGDILATVGHHRSETLIGWQVQIGLLPL